MDLLDDIVLPHPGVDYGLPASVDLRWVAEPLVMRFTAEDMEALAQLRVLLNKDSNDDVLLELLRRNAPSRNGHAYEVICAGCGLAFQTPRRPLPGRKHWCDNCRKTGEPGADRARRYRARKAQEAK